MLPISSHPFVVRMRDEGEGVMGSRRLRKMGPFADEEMLLPRSKGGSCGQREGSL